MGTRPTAKNAVVFIDHSPRVGGATRMLLNLLEAVDRNRIMPIIVCPSSSDSVAAFTDKGFTVETTNMPWFTKKARVIELLLYPYHLLAFTAFILKLSRTRRISLVHANNFISLLYSILPSLLLRVPLLWHMQDILERGFVNRLFIRIAGRVSDRIICVSGAVRARLLEFGVADSRCSVIYNYLSAPGAGPRPPATDDGPSIPPNVNVVAMIGNICFQKGQTVLLAAAPSILKEFPVTVFLIIGDTITEADKSYKNGLKEQVLRSGLEKLVIMAGFRNDIFELLGKIDILVHPAVLPEAFGLAILEAMCKGIPVVASDIGGIPELVQHTVNGLLVPPDDSAALARSVRALLRDPSLRSRMGEQGRAICRDRFSREQFIDGFNAAYRELIRVEPFS